MANLLCQHGYFFPVGECNKNLSVKDDSSLYRFQVNTPKKKKNICPIVCACVFVVRLLSDVPSANPVTLQQQLEPRKRPGVIEDLPRGGESSSYLCAIIKGDWTRPVHFSWAFFVHRRRIDQHWSELELDKWRLSERDNGATKAMRRRERTIIDHSLSISEISGFHLLFG